MATPSQVAANQANAAHSTGPRTEEGKNKTRGNATRHGLCSTTPVMSDEDQSVFNLMHDGLLAEHCPATPTEEMLVFKMAVNFFSFARAENFLSARLGSSDDLGDSKEVALMMRYQNAADRHFNRNLSDLRQIQKERRCPRVQPDATTDPSAARSQAPPHVLPTSHVRPKDTGQQPCAMERDPSIGSVLPSPESAREVTQPPSDAQPGATTYPSNQPSAIRRYRSIGFVPSTPRAAGSSDLSFQAATCDGKIPVKAAAQPAALRRIAPKTEVCVTADTQVNPQKAA
jgi:hypothetical protein